MESSSLQPLVEVGQHNIALLFCNYLISQSITAEVKATNDRFVILVNEHYLAQARNLFEEFIQQPHHSKYQQAAWDNAQVTEIQGGSSTNAFMQQFLQHAGVVTLLVFSACWLVFLLSILGWHASIFEWLRFYTVNNEIGVLLTEPWRLVGPALFHFSWLHIVFNTMWWWQIGGSVEKIFGKGELLQLFFLSAILSNLGQFLVSGPNFGGLSGVVYALVGYAWWAGWLAPEKGLSLSKPIVGFLLVWLLLGYTDFMPVNMANTAHLLGLISGCFLAWWRFKVKKFG